MIGHDDHQPLTPEERELAQRLARLGAPAEPSSALDARILSAARTAAGAGPAAATDAGWRTRMGWPIGLGLAASLALAVGIAWQLRPLPNTAVEYSEAPRTATTSDRDQRVAADAAMADESALSNEPRPAAQIEAAAEAAAAAPAEPAPRRQVTTAPESDVAATEAATPEPEPVTQEAPEPIAFPASPSSPPPPAPAAPPLQQTGLPARSSGVVAPQETQEVARQRQANAFRTDGSASDASTSSRDEAEALDRLEVDGSRLGEEQAKARGFRDQPFDETPPASADSPEVRKAWLARIRELVAEGRRDAARASLQEFRHRYPLTPVPDDLRPLIE